MPATKDERLNLRISVRDDALIRDAADALGTSVSEYVTASAVQRAHQVLADQRHFTLDQTDWDRFLEVLDRPIQVNERLASYLKRPSLIEHD
jgi:uncharacterized protein (DUF1778 family)